jgi:hypothetical protein
MQTPLVFITGASSGIGQALAAEFYRQGWCLGLVARRADAIHDWAQAQKLDATRYAVYAADVADSNSIIAAGQACMAAQGLPDMVIANAGVGYGMDSRQREDLDSFAAMLQVNNIGMAATFHPFIAAMQDRGSGKLVGIASVAAIRGLKGHGAYCASKSAVVAYCESLRLDLHGSGVQVTALLPGYVATPLTSKNSYGMPFMLSAAEFAARSYRFLAGRGSYGVIPWQMGVVAKLLRILPNSLYDAIFAKRGTKKRQSEGGGQ